MRERDVNLLLLLELVLKLVERKSVYLEQARTQLRDALEIDEVVAQIQHVQVF